MAVVYDERETVIDAVYPVQLGHLDSRRRMFTVTRNPFSSKTGATSARRKGSIIASNVLWHRPIRLSRPLRQRTSLIAAAIPALTVPTSMSPVSPRQVWARPSPVGDVWSGVDGRVSGGSSIGMEQRASSKSSRSTRPVNDLIRMRLTPMNVFILAW
jgi:hypothetical protein